MENHIQIRGVSPRIQYVANGENTIFEFPFAIFKSDNLQVYIGGNLQNSNTYSVSGVGNTNGGSVTFSTAPESGAVVTLFRNLSIERTTDFQEGGTLRANALNYELDYQIACQQQIADNLNRSMMYPPYATNNDVDLTLPYPDAGKAIVWNATGTNLENSTLAVNDMINTLEGYKNTAVEKAAIAVEKADLAAQKATAASQSATAAGQSATAAAASVTNCANLSLSNVSSNIDYVVSAQYDIGGGTYDAGWYRKWKSGWVEQGGYVMTGNGTSQTVNFYVPFSSTNFTLVIGMVSEWGSAIYGKLLGINYGETSTSFKITVDSNTYKRWYACGFAATETEE